MINVQGHDLFDAVQSEKGSGLIYVYAIFVWHVAYLCMSPLYFQKGEDLYEDVVGMRNCKRVA